MQLLFNYTRFSLEAHWIIFLITYLIIFLSYFLLNIKRRNKLIDEYVIINAFFIFYILSVIRLVFTPIELWNSEYQAYFIKNILGRDPFTFWEILNINLIPFRSLIMTLSAPLIFWRLTLRFVFGNFILLLPLPIFLGLKVKKELTFKQVIIISFLTTLFIEISQLLINILTGWPNHLVCVDDLLLNILGAIFGYFIFKKKRVFFEKIIS